MNNLNILETHYNQTGKSRQTDDKGMLEMQARAYRQRNSQYILIKSPPASGKSRAMMFLALDKLENQGIKKVIIAVPEMTIGASFKTTNLKDSGFSSNWYVDPKYNLCIAGDKGGKGGKGGSFADFINDPDAEVLLCTHAALRSAFEHLEPADFDNILLGIDEFHHTSSAEGNVLGGLVDAIIEGSSAHIVAMTGSYFRGDAVPIMLAEYESMFTQVTYSYYEQLNGYEHLKSLGISYHFYKQVYLSSLHEVLDTTKKTIIHIPNVNSSASTKQKHDEVDAILDVIGTVKGVDPESKIITVETADGRLLKVADLVDPKDRELVQRYLMEVDKADDLDIIIALGMAKEGFDWVWCEHVLTIGYRSSLTEVIQIIGRATRDCKGKTHAQFTNMIAEPDAQDTDVNASVNNLLKAITVSLLMMQVLTPNITFKPRSRMTQEELKGSSVIAIDDTTQPMSDSATQALSNLDNLAAALMQKDKESVAPLMTGQQDVETFINFELPKLISKNHPDLTDSELQELARALHKSLVIQSSGGVVKEEDLPSNALMMALDEDGNPDPNAPAVTYAQSQDAARPPQPSVEFVSGNAITSAEDRQASINRNFALIEGKFIDVEKLGLNMIEQVIESINPFEGTYSILSKTIDATALKAIESYVTQSRSGMTKEEAVSLYGHVKRFVIDNGREPALNHTDHYENRLALALALIKDLVRQKKSAHAAQG